MTGAIRVAPADPSAPGPAALLAQRDLLMASLFAPEDSHTLDAEELARDNVRFLAADDGAATVGIGALALREGYGEVKSMFTVPAARGRGVADAILSALIGLARAEGRPLLRLETGTGLDAAHRLYARHGFTPRGPFGDYAESPASLFFERRLE